jgi:hypothetical protein
MSGNTSATGGYIPALPPPPAGGGAEIAAALQSAIATLTGLPGNLVRPRWQATPPTQPPVTTTWASVGISGVESTDDYPFIRHDGAMQVPGAPGPGADILTRQLTYKVIVTFYGPSPDVLAGLLRDGFYIQQNWEALHKLGCKLHTVRDLSWTPEMVNQQWVDRFDVEMTIRQMITRVYPVLNIVGADILLHPPPVPDGLCEVREDTVLRP